MASDAIRQFIEDCEREAFENDMAARTLAGDDWEFFPEGPESIQDAFEAKHDSNHARV